MFCIHRDCRGKCPRKLKGLEGPFAPKACAQTRLTGPCASARWLVDFFVSSSAELCPVLEQRRAMRVQFVPEKATLSLRNPENLIVVENSGDSVVIRATRDNFSEREKVCFIRYLAAEGFISDEFEHFRKSDWPGTSITWVVDHRWVRRKPAYLQRVDRFMIQLFVFASILWLAQMSFAFLSSAR